MAIAEPYPLAFLSNLLAPVSECSFDLARFEENSGSGSGQHWAAQLATPLWQIQLPLSPRRWGAAREINAKIFALGSNGSFLFDDRSYRPATTQTPGSAAKVGTIAADRRSLAITGLSASYRVTAGDRLSIAHSSGRIYFGQFVESVTAAAGGTTGQIAVEPPLPHPIATGAAVVLDRPLIRVKVPQGNFAPFRDQPGRLSSGAVLNMVQKL